MSIKIFRRIVLRQTDINVFEKDAVEILGPVDIVGSTLRCRDEHFVVFL